MRYSAAEMAALLNPYELTCAECGGPMELRETMKHTYRDGRPRKFYGCSRYPACKGTVGAHPDGRPLGVPGTREVKALRHELHTLAGQIWLWGNKAQQAAMYDWIKAHSRHGHIAEMGEEELRALRIQLEVLIAQRAAAEGPQP